MKSIRIILLGIIASFSFGQTLAQEGAPQGSINGNVSVLWQYYTEDTLIGAIPPPEKAGFNAYGNLIYTRGNFSAGMRYESYLSPVLGYPGRFKGTGIGYRYAQYTHQKFDITIGNFYEQFGSGMIFRSYEERNLGIDNAMDGFRVKFNPIPGIYLTGIYGQQRFDFDSRLINGDGLVRAGDAEFNINDFIPSLNEAKTRITLGASMVSKYQSSLPLEADNVVLIVPENVTAYAGRLGIIHGGWNFQAEYVQKGQDPNSDNFNIYKKGEGAIANLSYSKKGFGFNLGAKMIDNMSFRSDRDQKLFDVPINYIPAVTKQHTYILAASLYPYATVINGESSFNAELFYKIKKDTPLGGKYGTNLTFNFAAASNIDTTGLTGLDGIINGYARNSYGFGKEKFIRDFNFEISKKISKKLKLKYTYFNFEFNTQVTPVTNDFKGIVYADIHALESTWKIKPKHSLRTEFQMLFTKQDKGDWLAFIAEYNLSPHWFFSVIDQFNYGNPDPDQQIHYLFGTFGYINGSNRISMGFGKRREGIFCIGGVCRAVPASNGVELTLTSSF